MSFVLLLLCSSSPPHPSLTRRSLHLRPFPLGPSRHTPPPPRPLALIFTVAMTEARPIGSSRALQPLPSPSLNQIPPAAAPAPRKSQPFWLGGVASMGAACCSHVGRTAHRAGEHRNHRRSWRTSGCNGRAQQRSDRERADHGRLRLGAVRLAVSCASPPLFRSTHR